MTRISITRKFDFCAGHRVWQHESKCQHMHGHNYTALITCSAPQLDNLGRVLDFSEIKTLIGRWIDDNWDHSFLVYYRDEAVIRALLEAQSKRFLMPDNPTAENMAFFLMTAAQEQLPSHITVDKVQLWETPNCFAEVLA